MRKCKHYLVSIFFETGLIMHYIWVPIQHSLAFSFNYENKTSEHLIASDSFHDFGAIKVCVCICVCKAINTIKTPIGLLAKYYPKMNRSVNVGVLWKSSRVSYHWSKTANTARTQKQRNKTTSSTDEYSERE